MVVAPDLMALLVDDERPGLYQPGHVLAAHKAAQQFAAIVVLTVAAFQQALLFAALTLGTAAQAEVSEIKVAQQYGISYLPLMLMEEGKLIEKHAKAAGVDLKVNNLASCTLLAVLASHTTAVQRVPAVMDFDLLPDLGRMTP